MDNYTEGPRNLEFVLSECEGGIARDSGVFASGHGVILPGTVLGFSAGKYIPAVSGTDDPVAIAAYKVDTTISDADGVVVSRLAQVITANVIFDASFDTQAKKDAAFAALASAFIIAR